MKLNTMDKKNPIQSSDLTKTKEINSQIAKVTVQYIQNQQIFQKQYDTNNGHNLVHTVPQDDLEIENVEYLEENPNIEEYIDESGDKDFEDNFYPNAVHCLLDMYKNKYESLNTEDQSFKAIQLWRSIAKDMQESFFDFNERQIQHKYGLLRKQYFAVQSKEDIENFDYFEQLHDIYKDVSKDSIAKGLVGAKKSPVYYKDEELLQSSQLEIDGDHMQEFKSKEIAHKEHEFIDMVEKELQAMEDGLPLAVKETAEPEIDKRNVNGQIKTIKNAMENQSPNAKRIRLDSEEPPQRKAKSTEYFDYNEVSDSLRSSIKRNADFSLYHYNQEQERRHREKISLLERSLQIQERALEQQQNLLQELIKRLPS